MQKTIYPSTLGVPRLALIGSSGAGKSTLVHRLLPLELRKVLKIVGKPSAQTTLIPTHFYIDHRLCGSQYVKLRAKLRPKPADGGFWIDTDAVYTAVEYVFKNSSANTFPVELCNSVSGAVRLSPFKDDPDFKTAATKCYEELSKGKTDVGRRQVWDALYKAEGSCVRQFLRYIESQVKECVSPLIDLGEREGEDALRFSIETGADDRQRLSELLDPCNPWSLIVEEYELSCGMGRALATIYENAKDTEEGWIDSHLPFRLILADTAGLTQDNGDDAAISRRLTTALNTGCHGILLMMPPSIRDKETTSIFKAFKAEQKRIKKNGTLVALGITKVDEAVAPTVEFNEDWDAYREEMKTIVEQLAELRENWVGRFKKSCPDIKLIQDVGYITTHPKKIIPYLEALGEPNPVPALNLNMETTLTYLFDLTVELQRRLLPGGNPIFFKATEEVPGGMHFKLSVVNAASVNEMSEEMSAVRNRCATEFERLGGDPLHGNTADAFYRYTLEGRGDWESNAKVYANISTFIIPLVRAAANATTWKFEEWASEMKGVDIESLKSGLNLVGSATVSDYLCRCFKSWIGGNKQRCMYAVNTLVSRLSYSDPQIKRWARICYVKGCREVNQNYGVRRMLSFYWWQYQHDDVTRLIKTWLDEELSKVFNGFFYPIYPNAEEVEPVID